LKTFLKQIKVIVYMDQKTTYALSLLKKLVAINTDSMTKENHEKIVRMIELEGKKIGLHTKILRAHAPDGKPRPNIILSKNVGAKKTIILLHHYDVVPAQAAWKTPPFTPTLKNGKLYGRGASDSKAGIAISLAALKECTPQVNVKMIVACDEEVGGTYGAKFLTAKHLGAVKGDLCYVLDGGTDHIATGTSGVIHFAITVKGKQGHAGYPFLADNAIDRALPFLNDLRSYAKVVEKKRSVLDAEVGPHKKVYGRFSLTVLHSGSKTNTIPGELECKCDLRMLPEENFSHAKKEFFAFFSKLKKKHGVHATAKIESATPGSFLSPTHHYVQLFADAAKMDWGVMPVGASFGGNDGTYFSKRGIPAITFGPIDADNNIHAPNEFMRVSTLQKMISTVSRVLENFPEK
jgi:succinyl-diaminopimelate desuccinylase